MTGPGTKNLSDCGTIHMSISRRKDSYFDLAGRRDSTRSFASSISSGHNFVSFDGNPYMSCLICVIFQELQCGHAQVIYKTYGKYWTIRMPLELDEAKFLQDLLATASPVFSFELGFTSRTSMSVHSLMAIFFPSKTKKSFKISDTKIW